ncbi:MAG: molybdenum cofactor biosynthesis protein MoaE [Gemmatimonas sp.]
MADAAISAGIAPTVGGVVRHVAIVDRPIDVARLSSLVEDDGVGAISLFLGTVRNFHDGRDVAGIDYEAYQPMAERELRSIVREIGDATPGLRLAVEHRVGTLVVGDVSVAIAAGHARRAPALAATQLVIEALKQRVPIWKREHYLDGERRWVDPTA